MGMTKSPETLRAEQLLLADPRPSAVKRALAADGIDLSLDAIKAIKQRMGGPLVNVDASEFIPWPIRREHQSHFAAQRLRDLARILRKPPLPVDARRYALVRNFVADLKSTDMVIDYDPERGFIRVPRRYVENEQFVSVMVDQGWIRDPTLNDDGTKIDNWIKPGE